MKNVGIVNAHLQPFGIFLWSFSNLVVILVNFTRFGILCQEKSGNPDPAGDLFIYLGFCINFCHV
jgi:hypothetical protein